MFGTLAILQTIFMPHVHFISCHLVRFILNPCHYPFRDYTGNYNCLCAFEVLNGACENQRGLQIKINCRSNLSCGYYRNLRFFLLLLSSQTQYSYLMINSVLSTKTAYTQAQVIRHAVVVPSGQFNCCLKKFSTSLSFPYAIPRTA